MNLHATALVVGDRGILISGASGSGKTALALSILSRASASGGFAALVADDRVLVESCRGRLLCRVPSAIAGLVEVRGRTPRPVMFEPSAVIDLAVTLVEAGMAPRYLEPSTQTILDCAVPSLMLASRSTEYAAIAVSSWLGLRPFRA